MVYLFNYTAGLKIVIDQLEFVSFVCIIHSILKICFFNSNAGNFVYYLKFLVMLITKFVYNLLIH